MPDARAIADINAGLVLATVDINAPIERVFAALTDPDQLPKWWGADDLYRTTAMTSDLREGGVWKSSGVGADGTGFDVGGTYTRVEAPHRLEMTWRPSWESFESHVSYNLTPIEGGTRVTLRHSGFGEHAQSCGSHASGWERVLTWLEGYFAPEQGTAPAFVMKLIPPRATFPFDATPEEMADMQAHVVHWQPWVKQGAVLALGPVADGSGAYGLGVVRGLADTELQALQAKDPIILSGRGFRYETAPMLRLMTP
ncbi:MULTISPECIES: SRPBCC domain-containing protein [Asticcacaulis]|uniref:SRPBCC family protein n=1 Tax=Asticcacaulis TaxID=76890 RepID=UPI001AE58A63|nr:MULTISPECIES: SRPBCC domain-containing protein [Asticcacaulis]MBP2160214.1 uncharacterized protein YndB with AHSA1/START domain [Asticcacaulis solisilvae]MDR6801259.1 uncharacterized protein YndB with AHSA1/START domain [Asticcacaulis sp. BE141]